MVRPQSYLVVFWEIFKAVYNVVIPEGDVVTLIAVFTQHMLYSYGKFISGSVGAYTLEAALMGCSMDKGRVKPILRVWKS